MKIIVAGYNGMLASELHDLKSQSSEYIFLSKEEFDITNLISIEKFLNFNQVNVIINCAAYTAVDDCEANFNEAISVNEQGVKNLVLICNKFNIKLIHISTDYVFDGTKKLYKIYDKCNPINNYGKSKLGGEQIILNSNIESIIIRTSWLYSNFGKNFVKTMIYLMKDKKELKVVDDQIGRPTNAKDLAKFIVDLIELNYFDLFKLNKIVHFSNDGSCSWYEFSKEIKKIKGYKTRIHPVKSIDFPTTASRPKFSILDLSETKSIYSEIKNWKLSLNQMLKI